MGHDTTPNGRLQAAASTYATHGLSVIPLGNLADKSPALPSWKPYATKAASPSEAVHWFVANGRPAAPGLAIVCGAVSGGLTVIDFDTTADGSTLYDQWAPLVEELAPGLLERLPHVCTPSGGYHVYFRCDVVEGNARLAESPRRAVWIETRGEGGYITAPPTEGYHALSLRVSKTPVITMAERALLLNAARSLTARPPASPRLPDGASPLPGDAFNARASTGSVVGMLTAQGWSLVREHEGAASLRRPGKEKGISATVRACNGTPITYVFSTNAAPLPSGEGLSPFAVYTYLNHDGDYGAAARALGTPRPAQAPPVAQPAPPADDPEPFDWRKLVKRVDDLRQRVFAPLDWVVEGVIPPGLTLVAGSPKAGKSLFGWNIALAAATGGVALGNVKVKQRDVVYLMLEDGERLVQKRLNRMLAPDAVCDRMEYAQTWRKLNEGGTEDIGDYCAGHPGGLVVIDTYESLRGTETNGMDSYRNDYRALKPLHDLVKANDYNVLIIHHTNKRHAEDPFLAINGSNGISGVADTIGILRRGEDPDSAVLHLRGRELDADVTYALDFDPLTGCHRLLGEQTASGKNPGQQAIVSYLRGQGGDASPAQIASAVERPNDKALLMLLGRMVDAGTLLKSAWGRYSAYEDPTKVTKVTGPFSTQSGDSESPIEVGNEPVTFVTFAPSPDCAGGQSNEPPAAWGIPRAVQLVPCPGCGKHYTKRPVEGSEGSARCTHCGTEAPIS